MGGFTDLSSFFEKTGTYVHLSKKEQAKVDKIDKRLTKKTKTK